MLEHGGCCRCTSQLLFKRGTRNGAVGRTFGLAHGLPYERGSFTQAHVGPVGHEGTVYSCLLLGSTVLAGLTERGQRSITRHVLRVYTVAGT